MNKEDYNKFYIQGSDHYLIPKDVFDELFDEMKNWKEENQKLKAELQLYQGALKREHEAIHRVNDLKEVIDKAVNDIQEIIDAVNKNTIIAMKQFNFKLEIIQDELSGSNDILKEVE